MRVLFNTYPTAFHTPGGGEIQLQAYHKHLAAYGVEVTLFDQWHPRFLEHDLVHYFSCVGGSSHYCAFIKRLGLPLVVSSSLWITEKTKDLYPLAEIRHQLDLADCIVTNSDLESETLSRVLDLPREKFVTVYNGVDECYREQVSPELFRSRFGVHQPFVLNVGNIEPRKNQLRLVEAMKAFPHLKLVLLGHMRDPEYGQLCISKGGEQVQYIGVLPYGSRLLRSAYSACDLFVLPSMLETPGLAALEAAASGAGIVVTREGSTKEYFGDMASYLDPEDKESIVRAITEGLSKGAHSLSRTDVVGRYAWAAVIETLVDTYFALKRPC